MRENRSDCLLRTGLSYASGDADHPDIQDIPVNTEEKLKIDFHFVEKGTSTLFLYKRKNNFYIEQPYNGIYKITEREYEKIKKFSLEE